MKFLGVQLFFLVLLLVGCKEQITEYYYDENGNIVSDSDPNAGGDSNSDTDSDTDSDMDVDSDSDSDVDSDIDVDTDSDTDADADSDAGTGGEDTGDEQSSTVVFPGEQWDLGTPEEHGLKVDELNAASAKVGKVSTRYCFLVIKDGFLVHEKYYSGDQNTRHIAYSVTKTLSSAMVGVAYTKGLIDLDDPISQYTSIPWGMNANATVKHVLSQTAESSPPGSGFSYNSTAVINSLGTVVSTAARKSGVANSAQDFVTRFLTEPIGMKSGLKWTGDTPSIGFGSSGTCRAYARLGWLLLNKGNWDGEQIIDEEYVEQAIAPSFPKANTGYGYLMWLNNGLGTWHRPATSGNGQMIKNAPETLFMATGFFGQLIFMLPQSNTVVVTMGNTIDVETLNTARQLWNAFGTAVVK